MFPDELEAELARCPVVYLTYGPCEPHGLHNAVGLDALKAHGLACRTAEEHGGIVAPPFFWHICDLGLEARWSDQTIGDRNPWSTSLPPWVLYHVFLYQLRNVAARGFHAAIVMSGHAPYQSDFARVSEIFMRHSPLRIWAGGDSEAVDDKEFESDHAGRYETSMLWALRPDLVDYSRLATGPSEEVTRTMATGRTAAHASRRDGEEFIAARVAWLGARAQELLDAYRPPEQPAAPAPGNPLGALTYEQTERIWLEEVVPALPELASYQPIASEDRVDPGSPWAPNEPVYLPV
jgi:creatinine amidohydrolase